MMNGKELAIKLAAMDRKARITALRDALPEEDYPETLPVALEIVNCDLDLLRECNTSLELQNAVAAEAVKQGGEYARVRYIAGSLADPGTPGYADDVDGGLSFVCFGDLWDVLERVCTPD